MRLSILVSCLITASVGACGLIYDVRQSGVDEPLQVASTAKVGQSVTVNLVSSGANGCYSGDRVDVAVDHDQRRVVLTPYVKTPRDGLCSALVIAIPMTASFTPRVVGTYRLEAAGSRRNGISQEPTVWTADVVVTN